MTSSRLLWVFVGSSALIPAVLGCFEAPDPTSKNTLVVMKSGAGTGRVVSVPNGLDCGETCTAKFPAGSNVALRAEPAPGSRFAMFTDGCEGEAPCTVGMDHDQTVGARFELIETEPTLAVTVLGAGTVASSPGHLSCAEGTCSATYMPGQVVSLSASAPVTSRFKGWSGDCSGKGSCTVTMNAARSVTAEFEACEGACPWAYTASASGPLYDVKGAVAANGDVYLAGQFGGFEESASVDFGTGALTSGSRDAFVARFDPRGNLLWATQIGGPDPASIHSDPAVDAAGNVVVAITFDAPLRFGGVTYTPVGGVDSLIARYSPSGALQWAKQVGTAGYDGACVATLSNGDVILASSTHAPITLDGISVSGTGILFRLDGETGVATRGQVLARSAGSGMIQPETIKVGSDDEVVIAGLFEGAISLGGPPLIQVGDVTSWDAFVARLTSTGAHLWSTRMGGTAAELVFGLTIDAAQNAYVAGSAYADGTVDFGAGPVERGTNQLFEPLVFKVTPRGDIAWGRLFPVTGSVGYEGGAFFSVAVLHDGDLVMAAKLGNLTNFGGLTAVSVNHTDHLEVRMDALGSVKSLPMQVQRCSTSRILVSPLGNRVVFGTQSGANFGVPASGFPIRPPAPFVVVLPP